MKQILIPFLLVFGLFFATFKAKGQTGMFGQKSSFEIGTMLAPTIRSKNKIDFIGLDTLIDRKLRLINSSFFFKYNRVLNNKLSASVGFISSSVRSTATRVTYDEINPNGFTFRVSEQITEMRYRHNAVEIGLDLFTGLSINPVGLYYSIDAEFGIATVDYSEVSTYLSSPQNFFEPFSAFNFSNENVLSGVARQYFTTFVRLSVGRKVVLSRDLTLNFETGGNILSYIASNNLQDLSAFKIFDELQNATLLSLQNGQNRTFLRNTLAGIKDYKRFFFNISASYYF